MIPFQSISHRMNIAIVRWISMLNNQVQGFRLIANHLIVLNTRDSIESHWSPVHLNELLISFREHGAFVKDFIKKKKSEWMRDIKMSMTRACVVTEISDSYSRLTSVILLLFDIPIRRRG